MSDINNQTTKISMEIEIEGSPEEWREFLKTNLPAFGAYGVACLIEGKEKWFINGSPVQILGDSSICENDAP